MDRYYRIGTTWEPSISGVDGAQVVIMPEGFEDKELYEKIRDFFIGTTTDKKPKFKYFLTSDKKPKFEIEFQCMKAKKKAKLTNVLSYEPFLWDCQFLIDEDVKNFLGAFNIAKHHLYEAKVFYKDQILKYWMFHIPYFDYDVIDFKGSVFYSGPQTRKEYVQVSDLSEYKNTGHVMPLKIALNDYFDKSLDFFSIRVGAAVFVSERLRDEFLKRGFTGVEFTPAFSDLPNEITLIVK